MRCILANQVIGNSLAVFNGHPERPPHLATRLSLYDPPVTILKPRSYEYFRRFVDFRSFVELRGFAETRRFVDRAIFASSESKRWRARESLAPRARAAA